MFIGFVVKYKENIYIIWTYLAFGKGSWVCFDTVIN